MEEFGELFYPDHLPKNQPGFIELVLCDVILPGDQLSLNSLQGICQYLSNYDGNVDKDEFEVGMIVGEIVVDHEHFGFVLRVLDLIVDI